MLLSKDYRLGKSFEELEVGASLQITENIEDKDLLLYLGLTNDSNPLYIQHEYAALTKYEKPIVPAIMLNGIVTSAISKYLPGPGSYVSAIQLNYPTPMYHNETLQMHLQIINKREDTRDIIFRIEGKNQSEEVVIYGDVTVLPPTKLV